MNHLAPLNTVHSLKVVIESIDPSIVSPATCWMVIMPNGNHSNKDSGQGISSNDESIVPETQYTSTLFVCNDDSTFCAPLEVKSPVVIKALPSTNCARKKTADCCCRSGTV